MCQKIEAELIQEMELRLNKIFERKEFIIDDHDGVHLKVEVRSAKFQDLSSLQRHRMVYDALNDLITSGELHSIKIETSLP